MGQCQQEHSLLPVCRTFLEHLTTLRQVITSFGTFWQNKVRVALRKRLNSRTRDPTGVMIFCFIHGLSGTRK